MEFYNGTRLLTQMDARGKKPEIYMALGNRAGGKTTFFNNWFFRRFIEFNEKFILLFRYNNEIPTAGMNFSNSLKPKYSGSADITQKTNELGIGELFNNKIPMGWAVSLNNADNVKKMSAALSKAERILFDDFLLENGRYLKRECDKFISLHFSIARKYGEGHKYLPCFMLANFTSVSNPYFAGLGVNGLNETYTKGNGFVIEQLVVEDVKHRQEESAFNTAFKNSRHVNFSINNISLDTGRNIRKFRGRKNVVACFKMLEETYQILSADYGIHVIKGTPKTGLPLYSGEISQIESGTMHIQSNKLLLKTLTDILNKGMAFFDSENCRYAFIELLNSRW